MEEHPSLFSSEFDTAIEQVKKQKEDAQSSSDESLDGNVHDVLVAPDTSLATIFHAVAVISPSVSICVSVFNDDNSGVETTKVAVKKFSPFPYE